MAKIRAGIGDALRARAWRATERALVVGRGSPHPLLLAAAAAFKRVRIVFAKHSNESGGVDAHKVVALALALAMAGTGIDDDMEGDDA